MNSVHVCVCVLTCVGVSQACVSFSTFLWYLWHRSVAFYSDECVTCVRGQEIKEPSPPAPTQTLHTLIPTFQDDLSVPSTETPLTGVCV